MNGLLRIVFIACMCFAGVAMAQTAQSGHVAIFKNVSGHVVIVRGEHEVVPVAGTQVMRTDVIRSGPVSSGGLIFRDGTALTVGASTEIEIRRYLFEPEENRYAFDVFLKKGRAVYASGKLAKLAPEAVSLSTPRATTGVRGTRFILKEE